MEPIIRWLRDATWFEATLALLAENLFIFVFSLSLGHWLTKRFAHRRCARQPGPLERVELVAALSTLVLNTLVTVAGLWLWRMDVIRFRLDTGLRAWLDVPILLLTMDSAMYGLHRLAHHPWLYPLLHKLHHRYENPRPLSLFVLNPAENLSFGALWLLVVSAYEFSWMGMSIYLFLNVVFGTLGHIGVEPFPDSWLRRRGLCWIAGSSFHAQHHAGLEHNFGFYTLIWDRIFGTLRGNYEQCFGRVPPEDAPKRAEAIGDRPSH